MEAEFQKQIAFYLTGKQSGTGLDPIAGLDVRPALFAGYRDLSRLRYDFPLVLVKQDADRGYVPNAFLPSSMASSMKPPRAKTANG